MVKLVLSNQTMVTLKRGNKTITRSQLDYETNKSMYDFRGFKVASDVVKEVKETTEKEFKRNNFLYNIMSSMRQKINDPLNKRGENQKKISQR